MSAIMMAYFGRLIRASWQAAVLVLIILAVQAVFRRRLDARWHYSLWLLVVARLLLPAAPRSAMSLFNYAGLESLKGKHAVTEASGRPPLVLGMTQDPFIIAGGEPVVAPALTQSRLRENLTAPAPPGGAPARPPGSKGFAFDGYGKALASLCALVWAIRAGLLGLRVVGKNLAFSRRLREAKPLAEPGILALFEECKSLLGIRFSVGLVETSRVISPALYGFFRPRLLLPAEMIGRFSHAELRYIFLHELAHVKRRDMAALWTVEFLKILHWFNPALWIAFRRMAADRELACDEMALSHAGEQERKPYGAAIIKVLESCAGLPALPGVIGILEDKDQMRRRISMILDFRGRPRRRALAIFLLLGLGLASLTDARSSSKRGSEVKERERPAAVSRFAQLRRGGSEADQVREFVAATHEKGVVTRETAFHDAERRPEFVLSIYGSNNPIERFLPTNWTPNPAAVTFSPSSTSTACVGPLLGQCMEVTGTRYLIDPEASSSIVYFDHPNTLNGFEFVAAFEGALQTNTPTIYSPMTYGVAVRGTRRENLMLIRESPGIVKVIPRSRLTDYQKAGLIKVDVE